MILTVEEFLKSKEPNTFTMPQEWLLEFAKLHVENALRAASEKATMNLEYPSPYEDSNEKGLTYANADEISRGGEYGYVFVDKDSILNAYPLENIK